MIRKAILCRSTNLIVQQKIILKILKCYQSRNVEHSDANSAEIQRILKYIQVHLFEKNLKVEKVKKECRLTNNNISTKFRVNVGLGIRQYIAHHRIRAAAFVLRESNVDIYLIADAIGYTSEYFSKLFKKEYGISPSEYRQSILRETDKKKNKE